jgi:hypothetical protein
VCAAHLPLRRSRSVGLDIRAAARQSRE